jgi:hypothetical protein
MGLRAQCKLILHVKCEYNESRKGLLYACFYGMVVVCLTLHGCLTLSQLNEPHIKTCIFHVTEWNSSPTAGIKAKSTNTQQKHNFSHQSQSHVHVMLWNLVTLKMRLKKLPILGYSPVLNFIDFVLFSFNITCLDFYIYALVSTYPSKINVNNCNGLVHLSKDKCTWICMTIVFTFMSMQIIWFTQTYYY